MFIPSLVHLKIRLNVELSSEEEARVRRVMNESFDNLKAVESEAARLRDRLLVLNQRKKDTEHFIKVHRGLLSPIRRLHPEILQEIFCRCLPVAHNSVLSSKEAPLLLGRVCSHWRQVAYSTPALWSSLHVTALPLTYPGSGARFEALDAWLTRSGILPLSISISTLIEHNIFSRDFRQYFDLIAKHVRRWKHIRFQLEDWRLMRIPLGIDADDLPLLEVFSIWARYSSSRSLLKKSGILMAPSLHIVSIHDASLRLLDLPVQWSKLTGLDSAFSNFPDILRLLSLCSNLETCVLKIGSPRHLSSSAIEESLGSRIVLPKLRTLNIHGVRSNHTIDLLVIIHILFAPALQHFGCQLANLSSPPHSSLPLLGHSSPSKLFDLFFQRLNKPLEEFDFCDLGGGATYLTEILYLSPGLKRLSLSCSFYTPGSSEVLNDRLLLKFIPHGHKNHCQSCTLDEEPEEESVEMSGSAPTSPTCLCPNLEVLYVDSAYFSRHILLEFLKSRLVDYDKYGFARLRRFSISFDSRWDDYDMKRDIDLLAQKSGLSVKLGHSPPIAPMLWQPPQPQDRDPFIEELSVF